MHNLQQVLLVAAIAHADPRTVKSFLAGRPTRPSIAARIEGALAELGLPSPRVRPDGATARVPEVGSTE